MLTGWLESLILGISLVDNFLLSRLCSCTTQQRTMPPCTSRRCSSSEEAAAKEENQTHTPAGQLEGQAERAVSRCTWALSEWQWERVGVRARRNGQEGMKEGQDGGGHRGWTWLIP